VPGWSRFCAQDPSIAVNEIDSTPWLTRTFEDEDDNDNDDDGLPDAVHTEINQAGTNQGACNQKNPIYGLNGQAEQDYSYSKQNTCCCGPHRERIEEPRFFRGVYVGRISDREDKRQEEQKNPNELEADRRHR